jgi:hypothetical protein
MLKEAGGYCCAEVGTGMSAPPSCELPDLIGVALEVILNADDRLPSRVWLAIGCHLSREDPLGSSYGLEHCHGFSQL